MSLPGLFLREARQQDHSLTQLPQDMDLWAENIVSLIREKLPESKQTTIKISFLKKNEELGTATGSAELFNQKLGKTIYVPLIVKNNSLCPLDVMMVPNASSESKFDIVPLTQDYFKEALFNGEVFEKLDKPFDRMRQLYGANQGMLTMPPTFRNVYASAQITDSIKDDMWQEDIDQLVNDLKSNPSYLVGYEKRANLDILKKIVKKQDKTASVETKLKNVSIIKKDLNSKYTIISTSDEAYDPIIETVGKDEIEKCLKDTTEDVEDTLHEVDRNGTHLVFNSLNSKNPIVHHPGANNYQSTEETPTDVKLYDTYKVQDKNGVYLTGAVLPNVIDYNMKPIRYKIFVNKDKSSISDKILGVLAAEKKIEDMMIFAPPLVGMTGTFVAKNEKNAIATFPLTIKSLLNKDGAINIVGVDLNGNKVKIKHTNWGGDNELQKIVKLKDYYILPRRFEFLPLKNFTTLSENKDSILQKAASAKLDSAPIKLAHTGASQFSLKGPDLIKMASKVGWNTNNLDATQTIFLLSAKRCSLEKTAQAIKIAGKFGESTIHGLPRIIWGEKVVEKQIKLASQWSGIIRKLKVNLVKEASHFEDAQMVDTSLSLNFINPDNLDKFIGFTPAFEDTIKKLAQTLLASRLGMKEIPEQSTATAMMKMVDVVRGLKRLSIHLNEESK